VRPYYDDTPDDPRRLIPYVEFYITNVCNLTCTNCNRFNNYKFGGYQAWSDYKHEYQHWAKHVKLQGITLLGGEPLLNPTINQWVAGINDCWNQGVEVLTNGTRLNHVPGLYETMAANPANWIGISLHNINDLDCCFAEIKQFLRGPVQFWKKDDVENADGSKTCGGAYGFHDGANWVRVWIGDSFYNSAVRLNASNRLTVHNSDPVAAHDVCGFVQYKCYHFVKGAFYKCGPVALFPEFDQQHQFDISDEDRVLMNSYQPLTADQYLDRGDEFFAELDNVIPQCKFCPSKFTNIKIQAVNKKANSTSSFI
jgi:hypothetical protein